jgi:hypothetical protein
MLVNMIGIEDNQDVVDLDSRRAGDAVDPKSRVTLSTLLQAALTSFPTSESVEPPARVSTSVSNVNDAAEGRAKVALESRTDAA